MKALLLLLGFAVFCTEVANAQSQPTGRSAQASNVQPDRGSKPESAQSPIQLLPDNPVPVQPSRQDGPAPCPAGVGKSCALLGGGCIFLIPCT